MYLFVEIFKFHIYVSSKLKGTKGNLGSDPPFVHTRCVEALLVMCFSYTTDSHLSFAWNIVCMCKSSYFSCHHPLLFLGGFSTELLGYSQDWVKPMWIHPLLLRVGDLPWNSPPQLWPVTSGFWINRYEMAIRLIHSRALCCLFPELIYFKGSSNIFWTNRPTKVCF